MSENRCNKCGEIISRKYCNPCRNKWTREYRKNRAKDSDYINSRRKKARQKYGENKNKPEYYFKLRCHALKKRSTNKKLPFNLTWEHLKDLYDKSNRCAITGIILKLGCKIRDPSALSVDRIIPKKGYVRSNIRLVSYEINAAMQNWGLEEFISLARDIKIPRKITTQADGIIEWCGSRKISHIKQIILNINKVYVEP